MKKIVFHICWKIKRCIDFHICMKKIKIVNRLKHFEFIDVMSMINDESMIINFENIIQWVYYFEYIIHVNIKMLVKSKNKRTKKSRFNDVINCTYVWIMFLRYKFIFEKTTMRHTIKRWLIRCIINDWINIKFLFWSLNVCITNFYFSNALSISKCLILFTNRKLNMRTFDDTSFLLTDWKTFFLMRSMISYCLNAANWKKAMCTIESSLKTTMKANIEIETKTKTKTRSESSVVLNTKLKYAVDASYFRKRSRSRLNEFEKISNSEFWSIEAANWTLNWDILIFDDFETNVVNDALMMIDDKFSRSWLLS
jgi:hypothetical protein